MPVDEIDLARHSARTPRHGSNFPICQRCWRPVDAVEQVHAGDQWVEIRGRCHGEEDVLRLAADAEEDAWRSLVFFRSEVRR